MNFNLLTVICLFALIGDGNASFAQDSEAGIRLRILNLNIYGKNEKSCKERFRAIVEHIKNAKPAYDIVSFNEHYNPLVKLWMSCDGAYLTKLMKQIPDYAGKDKSNLHKPKARFYQIEGANSVFMRYPIVTSSWERFQHHRKSIANGFMLNRIQVSDDLQVDVWTTHLESKGPDGCSDQSRLSQAKNLSDAIMDKGRNNPTIIMGDFNIGGPFNYAHRDAHALDAETFPYPGNGGYEQVIQLLGEARDLWIEANPNFKSGGYTYDCWYNKTIANPACRTRMRIDYILLPTTAQFQSQQHDIVVEDSKIVKWKTPTGLDVSDHYGVESTILIKPKK